MKQMFYAVGLIMLAGFLGLAGCKKEGGIDTAKVQSAFATASAVDKTEVQNAVTAVKNGDYNAALVSLQKVAASVNLTPEQKSALADLMNEVKAKVGNALSKAADDASRAAGDAAKAAQDTAGKAVGGIQKTIGK